MVNALLTLGIDVGTTKVAAVVSNGKGRQCAANSFDHYADVPDHSSFSLQNPDRIVSAVREALLQIPADLRIGLRAVGIAGQMHGILLLDATGAPVSNLVTWQDQRCVREEGFLQELGERTGKQLFTGYGCATLAWMVQHGGIPPAAVVACTIQDYLAARLCGVSRPVTDPTDAASLGLFDLKHLIWDYKAVCAIGIHSGLLPRVVATGTPVGTICVRAAREFGIPAGIPVVAALGDHPSSVFAMLERPDREIMLSLGTGGQLSMVVPRSHLGRWIVTGSRWECRPYLDDRLLVTAASLSAGSAWRWLAETVAVWIREAGGGEIPLDKIYSKLNELGVASQTEVTVRPHFLGERFDPSLRGAITGLDLGNFTLGSVARGLARGIIGNLREMLPESELLGRERLVGSGNALRKNLLLCIMAEEVLGLPLHFTDTREEAAHGASLLATRLVTNRSIQ